MNYPKAARVRTRSEYLRFFVGSAVKRLGACTIFQIKNGLGSARLGITIKAKVNSVYRNKLKRQIRESFRLNRHGLQELDFNVVVPGSVRVDHSTPLRVRRQLDGAWKNEKVV